MGRKGEPVFLLLVCCIVLASSEKFKSMSDIKRCATQLMKECKNLGLKRPEISRLSSELNSDVTAEAQNQDSTPTTFLSSFEAVLGSVFKDSSPPKLNSLGKKDSEGYINLTSLIQKSRNMQDSDKCYIDGMSAPMCFDALSKEETATRPHEEYDMLAGCAENQLNNPCQLELRLPKNITEVNKKTLMKILGKMHPRLKKHRRKIVNWFKRLSQRRRKCVDEDASDSDACKGWVTETDLEMLGPFIPDLSKDDIKYSPRFCAFFESDKFKPFKDTFIPSLRNELFIKTRNCTDGDNLERLGTLACQIPDLPEKLAEEHTKICPLLHCSAKLKKLLRNLIRQKDKVEAVQTLPCAVELLSQEQLEQLSVKNVMPLLSHFKAMRTKEERMKVGSLIKKCLKNTNCSETLIQDLKVIQEVVEGLPTHFLSNMAKNLAAGELKNISKNLRKSQALAIAEVVFEHRKASKLGELAENIFQAVPLSILEKANLPLDEVKGKNLLPAQACLYIDKFMENDTPWRQDLGSLIRCVTCQVIESAEDKNVPDMIQCLTENQFGLSKDQAQCASNTFFKYLNKQRPDYLNDITAEELDDIPTVMLIHFQPEDIKDLPVSVCEVFLNKMKMANVTTLPIRSPSWPALLKRALRCLGTDLSQVTSEDMAKLGPLLCKLLPEQLHLLDSKVLRTTLQAMAFCDCIPTENREELSQLIIDTFGEPETWIDITVESMLNLLDKKAVLRLPKKAWMKEIISTFPQHVQCAVNLFELIVSLYEAEDPSSEAEGSSAESGGSNPVRRKRAANPDSDGNRKADGSSSSNTTRTNTTDISDKIPTIELITTLRDLNYMWSHEQLKNMTLQTFNETVDILGDVTKYSQQQLEVLRMKAEEAFGESHNLSESMVSKLGCIVRGFSIENLMEMDFDLNLLEVIAACGWTDAQLSAVWKGAAKYNRLSVQSLSASDMVELGPFICGLTSMEIQQLNATALTNAMNSINDVGCSAEVAQHFKALIIEAFGSPSSWTKKQVTLLGTFLAVLNATEMAGLDSSLFSLFTKKTIPLIPNENIKALTVAQLLGLGPDNAALVTEEQKKHMNKEQRDALTQAIEGSRVQTTQGGNNGAPSLAAGGMATFMNLLVFLLVSLVL